MNFCQQAFADTDDSNDSDFIPSDASDSSNISNNTGKAKGIVSNKKRLNSKTNKNIVSKRPRKISGIEVLSDENDDERCNFKENINDNDINLNNDNQHADINKIEDTNLSNNSKNLDLDLKNKLFHSAVSEEKVEVDKLNNQSSPINDSVVVTPKIQSILDDLLNGNNNKEKNLNVSNSNKINDQLENNVNYAEKNKNTYENSDHKANLIKRSKVLFDRLKQKQKGKKEYNENSNEDKNNDLNDLVTVEQKIEYAGETIIHKKDVEKGSKEYLKLKSSKENASSLDDIIYKFGEKKQISTLDKSEIDQLRDKAENKDADQLLSFTTSKNSLVEQMKFNARVFDRTLQQKRQLNKSSYFD